MTFVDDDDDDVIPANHKSSSMFNFISADASSNTNIATANEAISPTTRRLSRMATDGTSAGLVRRPSLSMSTPSLRPALRPSMRPVNGEEVAADSTCTSRPKRPVSITEDAIVDGKSLEIRRRPVGISFKKNLVEVALILHQPCMLPSLHLNVDEGDAPHRR